MPNADLQREFFLRLAGTDALAALFDHLPRIYLFVKDEEGRFMKVNQAALQLHGCNAEAQMIGKTDFDFHPPALAAQYVEEDRRVMESRRPLPDQVWLVTSADGLPRWYLCTKLPLFDIAGSVIGIAGVMRLYDEGGEAPGEYRRLAPALKHVLAHFADRVTVADMARRAHLSVSHLQREFQRLFGMTPSEYLLRVRLLMARRQLEQTSAAAGAVALACGFYDQSHFTRAFRATTGLSPLEYRRRFASRQAVRTARGACKDPAREESSFA